MQSYRSSNKGLNALNFPDMSHLFNCYLPLVVLLTEILAGVDGLETRGMTSKNSLADNCVMYIIRTYL